jgi:DNA-binding MarR family transcriptional regulator
MNRNNTLNEKEYIQINQTIFSLRNIYENRMRLENGDSSNSLGIGEMGVLMVIGQITNVTAQELSRLMSLTRGTISIYIKRLVARKFVTQTRSTTDKRNWNLDLTKKGLSVYESAYYGTIKYTKEIISMLNPEEQRVFHDLLLKVSHGNGYDWQ